MNNQRVSDDKMRLTPDDAIGGEIIVLAKGQRQRHVLKVTSGARTA